MLIIISYLQAIAEVPDVPDVVDIVTWVNCDTEAAAGALALVPSVVHQAMGKDPSYRNAHC